MRYASFNTFGLLKKLVPPKCHLRLFNSFGIDYELAELICARPRAFKILLEEMLADHGRGKNTKLRRKVR